MRKKLYCFLIFVFFLMLSPFMVEAKSYEDEVVSVNFGDGDALNLKYTGYKVFTVESDKSFYYNGTKYYLSDSDIKNGFVVVEGEELTYYDSTLYSENDHEFYALPMRTTLKKGSYEFTQEVCYSYSSSPGNTITGCNIDKGDISVIDAGVYDSNYFYGFLPFYKEDLVFDYIYFNLTFVNSLDSSDVIEINELGFFLSEGDIINYGDYFTMYHYALGEANSINNGNEYIHPYCFDHSFESNYNADIIWDIVECGNSLYLTMGVSGSGGLSNPNREYNVTFEIYVGETYDIPFTFNNSDISALRTAYYYDYWLYDYLITFDGKLSTFDGEILYIPIDNVITYSKQYNALNYVSFKLALKYVCSSNCEDSRAVTTQTTTEKIFHLDLDDPRLNSTPVKGTQLPNYYTIADKEEVIIDVEFIDNNGISEIGYYVSRNSNDSNYANFTYESVSMHGKISVSGDSGNYYIYYRVKENASNVNYYIVQKIIIDDVSPSMTKNNFNSYSSNSSYNDIDLNISFEDALLEIKNTEITSKAYYKIIKESEKESLTVDDVYNSSRYTSGVSLDKSNIVEDGVYLVCFVLVDFIGNKSDLICSNNYYLDVTNLTKEEVSATSSDDYVNRVKTVITISGVENGVSFKCGLFTAEVTNHNSLLNNCYNGVESSISVSGEAVYSLWIYAADKVGNYSLLKLDNSYYVDSLAPRITTTITGDKNVYSNNVKIDVVYSDMSNIDTSLLSYEFYLATYNENNFKPFTLEEGISYPFDYYGSYKLAIKVCDVVGNCNINISSDTYLIDTAKILLELIGDKTITILQFEKYKELGVRASKGNAGKNVVNIDYTIDGEVDTRKPGVYKITYSAGEGMNKVTIEREVVVKESKLYIVLLVSTLLIGEAIILGRLFIKRKKNDNI